MTIEELITLGKMGYSKEEINALINPKQEVTESTKEEVKEEIKEETPDYLGEIKALKQQIADMQKNNVQQASVDTLPEINIDNVLKSFLERND